MWRKLRRRTMAPSRPLMYPDQLGLVLIVVLLIAFGVFAVVKVLTAWP